jgi:acetylornithine deacetylase/succinyl-diaminopimelate desuccinylase-like protein
MLESYLESLGAVLLRVDSCLDQSREALFSLLRIPSISAQPVHAADCVRAAEWWRDTLADLGSQASIRETPGHPLVVAHFDGPPDYRGPHVLFYGHYDVQPVDPIDQWDSPPFEPQLVDGPRGKRFVARGAADDKGQTVMFAEALRAWRDAGGGIPARLTVLIEGEEEIGSPNLEPFVIADKEELACDVALISDTGMWDVDTPALTTRLRGMTYAQVILKGPKRDLHSGIYGGSALNPINVLTTILGQLADADGCIQLPNFYDDVKLIAKAQRNEWDALGFDESAFLAEVGLKTPAGEKGLSGPQRLWGRPTAEINGIWGGYSGRGAKTVIPAEAGAKVSFRLVPDQDPYAVFDSFKRFITERLPSDCTAEFELISATSAVQVSSDSPWVYAALQALGDEYGKPAALIGCGGSIPVVMSLRRVLGVDTLLMGFGLEDDRMHGPNEKFEQRCFHHGIRSHARLLAKFAERKANSG